MILYLIIAPTLLKLNGLSDLIRYLIYYNNYLNVLLTLSNYQLIGDVLPYIKKVPGLKLEITGQLVLLVLYAKSWKLLYVIKY